MILDLFVTQIGRHGLRWGEGGSPWFTEGPDTADLIEAEGQLKELL